jgi:hypothetical protein
MVITATRELANELQQFALKLLRSPRLLALFPHLRLDPSVTRIA